MVTKEQLEREDAEEKEAFAALRREHEKRNAWWTDAVSQFNQAADAKNAKEVHHKQEKGVLRRAKYDKQIAEWTSQDITGRVTSRLYTSTNARKVEAKKEKEAQAAVLVANEKLNKDKMQKKAMLARKAQEQVRLFEQREQDAANLEKIKQDSAVKQRHNALLELEESARKVARRHLAEERTQKRKDKKAKTAKAVFVETQRTQTEKQSQHEMRPKDIKDALPKSLLAQLARVGAATRAASPTKESTTDNVAAFQQDAAACQKDCEEFRRQQQNQAAGAQQKQAPGAECDCSA